MLNLEWSYKERNRENRERVHSLPDLLLKDRRELERLRINITCISKGELERRCEDGRCTICLDPVQNDGLGEPWRVIFKQARATNSAGEYPAMFPDEN